MLKKLLILFVTLTCLSLLFAQDNDFEAKDSFDELESGSPNLHFFNALNGEAISGATITLDGIGDFTTDHNGKISFEPTEDNYIQVVHFKANKFISCTFDVEIMAGTVFFNRFSASPVMNIDNFRVVIDWGKSPADLDAHFERTGEYHLSYRNLKTLSDGRGQLDRDDTNGFGPETITINRVEQSGSYQYYIQDYSNRNDKKSKVLSKSKAVVKVYGNGQLLHMFKVPVKQKGDIWRVFNIDNGKIIPVQTIS